MLALSVLKRVYEAAYTVEEFVGLPAMSIIPVLSFTSNVLLNVLPLFVVL